MRAENFYSRALTTGVARRDYAWFRVGDKVLFGKFGGQEVKVDGVEPWEDVSWCAES